MINGVGQKINDCNVNCLCHGEQNVEPEASISHSLIQSLRSVGVYLHRHTPSRNGSISVFKGLRAFFIYAESQSTRSLEHYVALPGSHDGHCQKPSVG
jgi:hypothetical protein